MDAPQLTGNVPPTPPPKGNDRIWTVLSHLSFFLGVPFILPLAVYLVRLFVFAHGMRATTLTQT